MRDMARTVAGRAEASNGVGRALRYSGATIPVMTVSGPTLIAWLLVHSVCTSDKVDLGSVGTVQATHIDDRACPVCASGAPFELAVS